MEQQTVLNKIRDIIFPYLDEPCEIDMETHLMQDLMINSFDYTSIITDIEETFKINIENLNMYRTKELVRFIMQNGQRGNLERRWH